MSETFFLPGNPAIPVTLRRNARARRLSLRVSRLDGSVTLTLPTGVSARAGRAFVQERRDWIEAARAQAPAAQAVTLGASLPVAGKPRILAEATVRAPRLDGAELLIPRGRAAGPSAAAFLRMSARERLAERVAHHAGILGVSTGTLTLRDTRSRWGSCTARGDLMFSWRIAMAPPEVLDYLAAHEVAHRREMNHSAAYWAQVSRLIPGYATPRDWLKTHGPALHRYDFGAA